MVGRNFGYDDRGVWVDGGCRGDVHASVKAASGTTAARSYGYTEPGIDGEKRVRCESEGGRRANCDADLRGYRFVEVRNLSRADCVIGRNFGYDDRGVWAEEGCRGEFVFADERTASRYPDDRYPVYSNTPGIVRCESQDGRTQICPADGAERVRLSRQLSRTECVEGKNWGVNRDGIWVDDGCRGDFEVQHAPVVVALTRARRSASLPPARRRRFFRFAGCDCLSHRPARPRNNP